MTSDLEAEIGDAERVALNYAKPDIRPKLASFFALDRRLGQIVANSSEPLLGQMRIAWWRDMLSASAGDRPTGDVVLDAIGASWGGDAQQLQPLADAWEVFLIAEALTTDILSQFAHGRAMPLARAFGCAHEGVAKQVQETGSLWALADTAAHVSDQTERELILEQARTKLNVNTSPASIPRALTVLTALSRRSVRRGGLPLMEGRGAALAALSAGLIGR
jgi:phytoene synthase